MNQLIAFDDNLRNVRFGQSERWFAGSVLLTLFLEHLFSI
jgi:hypothetical protein